MDLESLKDFKVKLQQEADPKLLSFNDKLGSILVMIYKAVSKPIVLPKIFQIRGEVEVTSPITIRNFQELAGYFKSLEGKLTVLAQAASTAPAPIFQVPKIEMPKMSKTDNIKVEGLLQDLVDKIDKFKPQEVKFPKSIDVSNFPVTHTPQPVTNISINALQGFSTSTVVTVGTSITKLPSYGQLFNRRSLIIFNNSAATTIYLGGSDVTTSTGLPVLAQTYSPAIDAGYNLIIYGVSAGSAEVRVFEVSRDQTANVQG